MGSDYLGYYSTDPYHHLTMETAYMSPPSEPKAFLAPSGVDRVQYSQVAEWGKPYRMASDRSKSSPQNGWCSFNTRSPYGQSTGSLKRFYSVSDVDFRIQKRANTPLAEKKRRFLAQNRGYVPYWAVGSVLYNPNERPQEVVVDAVINDEIVSDDTTGELVYGTRKGIDMFRKVEIELPAENMKLQGDMARLEAIVMRINADNERERLVREQEREEEQQRRDQEQQQREKEKREHEAEKRRQAEERKHLQAWQERMNVLEAAMLNREKVRGDQGEDENYLRTRERFLSTFKRNYKGPRRLPKCTHRDFQLIDAVNRDVHGGNCVVDAKFFVGDDPRRKDRAVYLALYGLDPRHVIELEHYPRLMWVLDTHAGNVCDPGHVKCDRQYHIAWETFINFFYKNKKDPTFLDREDLWDKTDVGRTYKAYEQARKKHVRSRFDRIPVPFPKPGDFKEDGE